jgi:hypothetical protein
MSRVAILLALLALCGCACALTGSDLKGEYDVNCVPARSNGDLREWHRDSNVWISSNQMREYAQIWDSAECDGKVHYEFDFSSYYTVGEEDADAAGQYALVRNFRTGHKNVAARTKEGQEYLEDTCEGTLFPEDVWVDVLDLTCAPLFFGCPEQANVEYGCVMRDADLNVQFCEVGNTHVEGPCLPGLASSTLDSAVYEFNQELEAPTEEELDGKYGFSCAEVFGLPEGWRVSETLDINDGLQHRKSYVYSNPLCEGSASFLYERWQSYVNGAFYAEFADQLLPTFEQNTQFVGQKNLRVKDLAGKAFMDSACDASFPLNDWVDISQMNCPPFIFSCGVELTCVYQSPVDGTLAFCDRDPVEGSCTPQTRTSTYFDVLYTVDAAAALVPATAAAFLLAVLALLF